jgi:hypothetical protein
MPKQELKMRNLGDVDGGSLGVAMDQAIKLVTQDLEDRPALDSKRKVTLTIELTPVVDVNSSGAHLESVISGWHVKPSIPPVGKASTVMTPQSTGRLAFHSDLPDAPEDETIMDEAERRRQLERDRNSDR